LEKVLLLRRVFELLGVVEYKNSRELLQDQFTFNSHTSHVEAYPFGAYRRFGLVSIFKSPHLSSLILTYPPRLSFLIIARMGLLGLVDIFAHWLV